MIAQAFRIMALTLAATLLLAGCGSKSETPPPEPVAEEDANAGSTGDDTGSTGRVPSEEAGASAAEEAAARYVFESVHFEFDQYRLTSSARSILTQHGKMLINNVAWTVTIEGHCDERGTVEYNLALGEKRAEAARAFLVQYGVASNRVKIISYGKEKPVDRASNETAWAKNRRDEFRIKKTAP